MLYRALYAYPTDTTWSGIVGYGLYLEAPDLETATEKAIARCSGAATLQLVTPAPQRCQK